MILGSSRLHLGCAHQSLENQRLEAAGTGSAIYLPISVNNRLYRKARRIWRYVLLKCSFVYVDYFEIMLMLSSRIGGT